MLKSGKLTMPGCVAISEPEYAFIYSRAGSRAAKKKPDHACKFAKESSAKPVDINFVADQVLEFQQIDPM